MAAPMPYSCQTRLQLRQMRADLRQSRPELRRMKRIPEHLTCRWIRSCGKLPVLCRQNTCLANSTFLSAQRCR
jgi:hypothetical protein